MNICASTRSLGVHLGIRPMEKNSNAKEGLELIYVGTASIGGGLFWGWVWGFENTSFLIMAGLFGIGFTSYGLFRLIRGY